MSDRVLVVDDSQSKLHELADALKEDGSDVVLAHSGEQALELLSVQSVDCILLDLTIPDIGRHETCRRIKALPGMREVPLILISAVEDRQAMIEGFAAGADDCLSKASDLAVVKARVRAQIRRKQFEEENRRIHEELLHRELEASEARAARQLAETRAALVEELERKNRELEAFSYCVSHDLRAPLRSIDGFSKAVMDDYGECLPARGQDYLTRVRTAAQRMGELIDDLLELSRVGRAEMVRDDVDLSAIAGAVTSELRRRNPERHVDVVIDPQLRGNADRRLMRILFENLIGNSWKFTAKTAAARIDVGVDCDGTQPVFFVRDNGAGFDMTYAAKLFQPFQRLHSVTDYQGTGIGLATVHRIVDRHGGTVWARGAVGEGATVFFTLPTSRPQGSGPGPQQDLLPRVAGPPTATDQA